MPEATVQSPFEPEPEPEASSHAPAVIEELPPIQEPLEDEAPIPQFPFASGVVSMQDTTSTHVPATSPLPAPEPLLEVSKPVGDPIEESTVQQPSIIEPPSEDRDDLTTAPSAETSTSQETPSFEFVTPHAASGIVTRPAPVTHVVPESTATADTPPSQPSAPAFLSLPPTPWAPQPAHDATQLAHTKRFAMLRAVANRWHHPLPTRRFLFSLGSRSEARKLAPIIRSLRSRAAIEGRPEEVLVCATGENPQSVRQALESLRITVDCDLDIVSPGEDAGATSARMLSSFESLLAQVKPQWLIVEGATTASAMASVAAYYAGIRVARVEGGPVPFNIDDPYPTELIRQVVGLFSSVHFAETDWSREHLVQEGVPDEEIFVIGNTGIDAVHETCAQLGLQLGPSAARSSGVVHVLIVVERRDISETEIIELCHVVRNLVGSVPGLYEFVWPLPASTALSRTIRELLGRIHSVTLTPPASYEDILRNIHACDIVLTDSPDLQEEAPSLGKPVLVMRDSVDRPEAVRAGVAMLVGTARIGIQAAVRTLARKLSSRHGLITNPYGDGRAAARIADFFEGREVLEFGRTTQPRMLPPGGQSTPPPAPRQLEASTES